MAIEVAKRTGIPLKIAGEMQPLFRDYFESQVKPHFDGKLIQFLGEADLAKKNELLGNSMALLFPIQWNEPFGLGHDGSDGDGNPGLALPGGAVREVIADGVSGYVCSTLEELVKKARQAELFNPLHRAPLYGRKVFGGPHGGQLRGALRGDGWRRAGQARRSSSGECHGQRARRGPDCRCQAAERSGAASSRTGGAAGDCMRKLEMIPEHLLVPIESPHVEPRIAHQALEPRKVNNLTLIDGKTFLSTTVAGDIHPPGALDVGFFHQDTRFLSQLELRIDGHRAVVLSSSAEKTFASQIELTTGNITLRDSFDLPENTVHIRREQLLGPDIFFDRFSFENFNMTAVDLAVDLVFDADFVDVFQVRGIARRIHGQYFQPIVEEGGITFSYRGLDKVFRQTSIILFTQAGRHSAADGALEFAS